MKNVTKWSNYTKNLYNVGESDSDLSNCILEEFVRIKAKETVHKFCMPVHKVVSYGNMS